MRIDCELCTACGECVPYCPMGIIALDDVAVIDQDECVDCGSCLRASVCPVDAIIYEPAEWPRSIREEFSNPFKEHTGVPGSRGRGTEEVKTNEITGQLRPGSFVLAIECGRPGIGARLEDIEKVAVALVKEGAKFRAKNPLTFLMDEKTGKIQDDVRDEKVMSAIIETVIPRNNIRAALKSLQAVTKEIDTVCSVDYGVLFEEEKEGLAILKELGIQYRENGKLNTGLGRPLFEGGS